MTDTPATPPQSLGGAVQKHIPLAKWLDMLGLSEYREAFAAFSGVENMLHLSEAGIRDLGVKNSAHRARIISSLVKMRQKLLQRRKSCDILHCSPNINRGVSPSGDLNHYSCTTVKQETYQPLDRPLATTVNCPPSTVSKRDMPLCPVAPDLTRYSWYHGTIPRKLAEKLVVKEGEFLVRGSISQPGDYVLTVCRKGTPLHFMLNKQVNVDGGQLRERYQFEEALFDSVPQLIQGYVDNETPVSDASGAILLQPVERCDVNLAAVAVGERHMSPTPSQQRSVSDGSDSSWTDGRPSVDSQSRRSGSQPLLSIDSTSVSSRRDKFGSSPSMMGTQRAGSIDTTRTRPRMLHHFRAGSEPLLSPPVTSDVKKNLFVRTTSELAGSESDLTKPPPAKPSRVPTIKYSNRTSKPVVAIRNKSLYEDDGRDYSDYDQVKSWPGALRVSIDSGDDAMENSKTISDAETGDLRTSQTLDDGYYDVPKDPSPLRGSQRDSTCNELPVKLPRQAVKLPDPDEKSQFDVDNYASSLLTPQNKPLEGSAVTTIRMLLLECEPTLLAQHITHVDLELLKVTGSHNFGVGVFSGLEHMTLPQGQQLRLDLLERFHCLKLFVATTLLMCTKLAERSRLLHKWIVVASHLKGIMGNLFSFAAVVDGLLLEQVSRLRQTWALLKRNNVSSDESFTTRLEPLLRSMDEAGSMLPLHNVTVPHIIPLVRLLTRPPCDLDAPMMQWETNGDLGIDIMLAHLDTGRVITENCRLYSVTGTNLMRTFSVDPHLRDMFRTETHLRLMWGAKGALVGAASRYAKFDEVLTVLSERLEPEKSVAPNRETSP